MKKSPAGFKNADNVMKGGVLLACHHGLTNEMINHMHDKISEFLEEFI